jgi:hypothetical protein
MKRFFTLAFLLTSFALFGQNLIPDPSAENFAECPTGLGILQTWNPNWQSFRGTPDYFNNCSNGLGSSNPLGYQEPRTGEGYLGLITFSRNLVNAREYLGVQLVEPLDIGQEYFLTFYVSKGHVDNNYNGASNNIGALFMTENFLSSSEQGPTPNFSSFNEIEIITDTVNWVEMSYQFVADSAYQFLAFGNFFDNSLTDTIRVGGETDGELRSYYYFDDFCLTTSQEGCDFTNATNDGTPLNARLYPNPCRNKLMIENSAPLDRILFYSLQGELLKSYQGYGRRMLQLDFSLNPGMYLTVIESEGKKAIKRFVVEN